MMEKSTLAFIVGGIILVYLIFRKVAMEQLTEQAFYQSVYKTYSSLAHYKAMIDIKLIESHTLQNIESIKGEYGVKIAELQHKTMEEYRKALESQERTSWTNLFLRILTLGAWK